MKANSWTSSKAALIVGLLLVTTLPPVAVLADEDLEREVGGFPVGLRGDDDAGAVVAAPDPPPPPSAPPPTRQLLATVTGYCLTGTMRNGQWTHAGAVAVDPAVIPLGTRLTIDGLPGVYVAADTGGGVRGAWVDVWFSTCSEALGWGRQQRLVTLR